MKGIDLFPKVLVQAGVNLQVVRITDIAELPVGADVSIQDVFDWARQQFNLEPDVCAYVQGSGGVETEVLRSAWKTTPAPRAADVQAHMAEARLLFKPPAKPDGAGFGLEAMKAGALKQLARFLGQPDSSTKADLVARLSSGGAVLDPFAEAEAVQLSGHRRSDGVLVVPLDKSKAATIEFFERKAGEKVAVVAEVVNTLFLGKTLAQVKKSAGKFLGLPSGLKKLLESGVTYRILVDGVLVGNDYTFTNGERVVVQRVEISSPADYFVARLIGERFIGKGIDQIVVANTKLVGDDVQNAIAFFLNDEEVGANTKLVAGDVAQIVFTKNAPEM